MQMEKGKKNTTRKDSQEPAKTKKEAQSQPAKQNLKMGKSLSKSPATQKTKKGTKEVPNSPVKISNQRKSSREPVSQEKQGPANKTKKEKTPEKKTKQGKSSEKRKKSVSSEKSKFPYHSKLTDYIMITYREGESGKVQEGRGGGEGSGLRQRGAPLETPDILHLLRQREDPRAEAAGPKLEAPRCHEEVGRALGPALREGQVSLHQDAGEEQADVLTHCLHLTIISIDTRASART